MRLAKDRLEKAPAETLSRYGGYRCMMIWAIFRRHLMYRYAAATLLTLGFALPVVNAADAKPLPPIEALKPFNLLIGKWNGAGVPEGTLEDRNKGHWNESLMWEWKFKGDEAWITVAFDKSKYFQRGELRHLPKANLYQLKLNTIDRQSFTFTGSYKDKDKTLALERVDEKTKDTHRLVFSLLHSNRIVYREEVKPADKTFYTKLYRVGATKDGEPFVTTGFNEKECVVSGGTGTTAVMYQGKTYYVCCSGCRDAFNESPGKYVAEFEKKRAEFNKKK
jgi:hypothetical protein